jgi:NAD(P)-dependent dehydrogenase (short-subunit alcohol dehydrogenase family)
MSKLQGKVAVVTGGSRDIGRAISIKLAKEGAKVVVNYFNSEEEGNETRYKNNWCRCLWIRFKEIPRNPGVRYK